jgi:diaminohydroxyphosphoribosylaminopyrimidine deaminase/5-amino-6-(5-phosphoribosylamino)uracil reductase
MQQADLDRWHMDRALELAARGEGLVEPNPMVGCIIARGAEIVGQGWHRRFGGPHAEIEALNVAGPRAAGATMYVTLEPCCHHGKTPPCTKAVLAAAIRRVVAAQRDPFPAVDGGGLAELESAGVEVEVGVRDQEAARLNAPYLKLLRQGRPWVIAKWAMTLDGKIATRSWDSRWISCEESRAVAHALRGRVDAILIGSRTATIDDPLLTARPAGPRLAVRVVIDSLASLAPESQLVRTALEAPVLVAVSEAAEKGNLRRLEAAGCELFVAPGATHSERLLALLDELGRRRMTNILVEGGGRLLGACFDGNHVDEVHVFIAPKLAGGAESPSPVAGAGVQLVKNVQRLQDMVVEKTGDDLYVRGRVMKEADAHGEQK